MEPPVKFLEAKRLVEDKLDKEIVANPTNAEEKEGASARIISRDKAELAIYCLENEADHNTLLQLLKYWEHKILPGELELALKIFGCDSGIIDFAVRHCGLSYENKDHLSIFEALFRAGASAEKARSYINKSPELAMIARENERRTDVNAPNIPDTLEDLQPQPRAALGSHDPDDDYELDLARPAAAAGPPVNAEPYTGNGDCSKGNVTDVLAKELWGFLTKITDCEPEDLSSSFYSPSPSNIPELSILLDKLKNKPKNAYTFYEYLLFDLPNEVLSSIVSQGNIIHLIKASSEYMPDELILRLFSHTSTLSSLVTSDNVVKIIRAFPENSHTLLAKILAELRPEDAQKNMKFGSESSVRPFDILAALGKGYKCKNMDSYKELGYEAEMLGDRLCRLILPKSKGGYADDVVADEVKEDAIAAADCAPSCGQEGAINTPHDPIDYQVLEAGALQSWISSEL